jgi:hypothetical protein
MAIGVILNTRKYNQQNNLLISCRLDLSELFFSNEKDEEIANIYHQLLDFPASFMK